MRKKFLCGVSVIICALASSAASAQSNADGAAQIDPSHGSASAANDDGGLEEIVVTAQRRAQNLQDVPIAVSTLTAETAQRMGVSGTESLQIATPGLVLNRQSGNGGSPFLRGVGTNSAVVGTEPPVAIYLDDVYLGTPQASIFQLANIEQVEVLKGPQGTLFGRNATGGVINVHTKRPSHEASLDATVGYGRFNTVDGSLYATGGLSDTIAVNFSAIGHKQYDGYGRNVTLGTDVFKEWNYGFRGGLLWEPASGTTILLTADHSKQWSNIGASQLPYPGYVSVGGARNIGKYNISMGEKTFGRFTFSGASARVEQDLDFAKLLSISSYRATRSLSVLDVDLGPTNSIRSEPRTFTNNFSQEIQLQSDKNDSLSWILGLFYFHSNAGYDPLRALGSTQGANIFNDLRDEQTLNSYSGFGEVRYEFLPATNLTVGLRYTTDKYQLDVKPRLNAAGAVLAQPFSTGDSFSKLTYRAILDHHFNDDVMAYASYSRGFKSGGYNLGTPGTAPIGLPPVKPEVLDAIELGIKSELFDKMLRLNASLFHYDYKNLQLNIVSGTTSVLLNAASVKIKGLDFDATVVPTDRLTVSFSGTVLNGKYSEFLNGPILVPNPAVCTPVPVSTGAPTGGNRQCPSDLSGNRTARSPKFSGSISATYKLPTEIGDFAVTGSLYHNSGFFWDAGNRTVQKSYQLLNSTLSWTAPSGTYEFKVWGKNLLNTYYYAYGAESTSGAQVSPEAPRTYGISATVHF